MSSVIAVDVEEFAARFVGPDVDDHTMDVRVLGPALLAFGNMHREAFRVAAPLDERVPRVRVQEVGAGSFEVYLAMDLTLLDYARTLLSRENLSTTSDIVTITGGLGLSTLVSAGIKAVLKRSKRQRSSKDELIDELGDTVAARIVNELQDNPKFVEGVQEITRPMLDARIDRLDIGQRDQEPEVSLDREDAEAINRFAEGEEVRVKVIEQVVTVATAQFEDPMRLKWRFNSEDLGVFTATMLDKDFVALVEGKELRLGRGSRFRVHLRVEEKLPVSGGSDVKRSYEVIWIRPVDEGEQLDLGFDGGAGE